MDQGNGSVGDALAAAAARGNRTTPAPSAFIAIDLEGAPRLQVFASHFEDELRLRGWLGRARERLLAQIAEEILRVAT